MAYPRLFRRRPEIAFEGRVHEQIEPSVARHGGIIRESGVVVEHLGYDLDAAVIEQKWKRNARLLERHLAENPADGYAWYQMGSLQALEQHFEQARSSLHASLRMKDVSIGIRAAALCLLGETELHACRLKEAEAACRASLRLVEDQVAARWTLACVHVREENFTSAIEELEELLRRRHSPAGSARLVDIDLDESSVLRLLGQCQAKSGDWDGAADSLRRSVEHPHSTGEALADLFAVHRRIGDAFRAAADFGAIAVKRPNDARVLKMLAQALWTLGRRREARERLDEAARCAPRDPDTYVLSVRWALDEGDHVLAKSILQRSAESGVRSYALETCGVDLAMRTKDFATARRHLEEMAEYVPKSDAGERERLLALARRLSA